MVLEEERCGGARLWKRKGNKKREREEFMGRPAGRIYNILFFFFKMQIKKIICWWTAGTVLLFFGKCLIFFPLSEKQALQSAPRFGICSRQEEEEEEGGRLRTHNSIIEVHPI